MKRLFSFFLAVLIGWGSVTQPARAFAPVAVLAAPQIVSAGGVSYALGAIAGVIGVTGLYLTIQDAQNNAVAIPLGDRPENQPAAPTAPQTATALSPGGTANGLRAGISGTCHVGATASSACQAVGGTFNSFSFTCSVSSATCSAIGYTSGCYDGVQVPVGNCTATTAAQCPSGYTDSGGTCTLSNPREATDDKRCDILLSNGQFSTAADMNCPASVDGTKLAPLIRDGKVIAYGQTSTGTPLMWEVTPGPQTHTIRQHEQVQTPTQTQVKTTTVAVDAGTGAITSVQTQTSPGSISSPATQTVPQTTTDPTTATNSPTVTKDETKPADQQTCGLPGSPACNVNDDGFEGKDTFSGPKSQEIADKLDQNKTQLENIKDSVPSIASNWLPSLMPGNATACTPLTFDFSVNSPVIGSLAAPNVKLDICEHLDLVRSILGYMLGLYTVWYVWRRFTTSNQGA